MRAAILKEFSIVFVIVTIVILIGSTTCHPLGPFWRGRTAASSTVDKTRPITMSVSAVKSFGDAKAFLRSWFERLRSKTMASFDQRVRAKRQATDDKSQTNVHTKENNESSFEEYERAYLLQQTYNYLKQIYYYSKYQESLKNNSSQVNSTAIPTVDTGNGTRNDRVLEEKLQELLSMTNTQLDQVFHNVRRAAEDGTVTHGIANLCCLNG